MLNPDSKCSVNVDQIIVEVPTGSNVIAALVASETFCTRRSVTGQNRFALCGIGLCQECRVTIDGKAQQLACKTLCRDGMTITTGAGA